MNLEQVTSNYSERLYPSLNNCHCAWSILESKGMHMVFQKKKAKICLKRAKCLKNWAKMYKDWKYLEKGQVITCDYQAQYTARKGPA